MQKLRGSGSSFSTSGKRWHNFPGNTPTGRKVGAQNAKRHRLKAAGLTPSKAELAALSEAAQRAHVIRRIPSGRRTIAKDRLDP